VTAIPPTGRDSEVEGADPRQIDGLTRRRLFGLDLVDAPGLDVVLDTILSRPASTQPGVDPVLVTPNVDIVVHLHREPSSTEAEVFRRAQYVLPDGMPLVAASRLLGQPLAARLTGSGLFELLWPRLALERRPVVVLCASEQIADRLRSEHPGASFVVPPILDLGDPAQIDGVIDQLLEAVLASSARLVLLGLGNPKDAVLAARLNERWTPAAGDGEGDSGDGGGAEQPLCCGLGGSFAMYVGLTKRAPGWVQRSGMEWLYRFAQEPRRLFHRYFVRDPAFIGIVYREYRAARAGRKGPERKSSGRGSTLASSEETQ
jgi:N-acetylglucosaminyldiphosphoundecaprenol N-acetyl-beta-D-mannosaminyltransferase